MKFLIKNILLLSLLNVLTFFTNHNIFIGIGIFSLLTYIPGSTILSLINYTKDKTILEKISLSAGLGTLFLLLLGLGVNELLPLINISQPLSQVPFMVAYNSVTAATIIGTFIKNRNIKSEFKFPKFSLNTLSFISLSSLLPLIAAMGAITLNNQGTNLIALFSYIAIGVYSLLIFAFNKKLSPNKISFSLFIIALSLLFMNSLRGWYNTGHDIQREFYVFNLTNVQKFWDINLYKDPYNACLSLTILPTIYSSITKINDYFIFKTLYQIIFSLTVVNIFYFLRRYFSNSLAYLASITFLFFPTFMTDMPMLNRQSLAFFYLSLMLYIIFDNTISKIKKTTFFISMSIGMVLSHYATSYVAAALFTFTYLSSLLINNSNRIKLPKIKFNQNINLIMVSFLLLFTIFWNGLYTQTSTNLKERISLLANNFTHTFSQNNRTGETLYSIFTYKPVPPEESLKQYIDETTTSMRLPNEEEAFYKKNVYSKYPINIHQQEVLKPISLLPFLNNYTGNIELISALRQSYAKIMQLLIFLGLVLFIFYRRHFTKVPRELYLLSVISITLIAAQVILPQNAMGYGVLRFFQQSLIIFSIFIVLGFYWILKFFIKKEQIKQYIIMSVLLSYFFLLSGVIPQIFGGYYPQLPLNNKGTYYNLYYTHKSEIATLKWVSPFTSKKSPLQTDSFDEAKIKTFANTFPTNSTLPAVIKKNSYVYLSYANVKLNSVYLYSNGGLIVYKYPTEFLDDNKNLIYSTSETKIYK